MPAAYAQTTRLRPGWRLWAAEPANLRQKFQRAATPRPFLSVTSMTRMVSAVTDRHDFRISLSLVEEGFNHMEIASVAIDTYGSRSRDNPAQLGIYALNKTKENCAASVAAMRDIFTQTSLPHRRGEEAARIDGIVFALKLALRSGGPLPGVHSIPLMP